MTTLDITSFGTNPSIGDISQALVDAELSSDRVECVVVASSVTLPSFAFAQWSNLTTVVNLDTCVAIGSAAFQNTNIGGYNQETGQYGLVDIGNCNSIGNSAFNNCYGLQSISLASGVTIPDGCFMNCGSLFGVTNLGTVVSIGAKAFLGCGLANAYIDSCRYLGFQAFASCQNMSEVSLCPMGVEFGQSDYYYQQFLDCRSIYSIENLCQLSSFAPNALQGCGCISELRLDNCTALYHGEKIWDGMDGVSKVTLNEGLWGHDTSYGEPQAGYALSGLKSNINHVDIMYSASSKFTIGAGLFSGCSNLTSVDGYFYSSGHYSHYYGSDPKVGLLATGLRDCSFIGTEAFRETKIGWGLYGKSEELANIGYIGSGAFWGAHLGESCDESEQGQDSDRGLWVDRNCVHMGAYAFADNPNLRWIGLPGPSHDISDITQMDQSRRLSIDFAQFSGCSGLSNIINLEFQKSFSTTAIVGCNSLPFLNLFYVDHMSNIGGSADMDNVPVSYIHIGPALASQLSYMVSMFQGCSMLEHVTITTSIGDGGYQFSIPDYCFYGISTLTEVDGLYSCYSIGVSAFAGTQVTFSNPDQLMCVSYIGSYAFANCPNVNVTYLGHCCHIGGSAFYEANNITELIFGQSLSNIDANAFAYCENLYNVYFNNSSSPTIVFGESAFANCGNLTNVCLTNTSQTVTFEDNCFADDTKLEHIYQLNTVFDGGFGDYMLYNTNVQENTITTSISSAFNDNTFSGWHRDVHLPNISMSQVPMDTKWGLEEGMKMYLSDGVIEG